jgi:hypothetical protein
MSHQITASKLLIDLTDALGVVPVFNGVGLPPATEGGFRVGVSG